MYAVLQCDYAIFAAYRFEGIYRQSSVQIVEQLGINYSTLAEWRKARSRKAREERIASDTIPLNEREIALYKEIQELKKANEILKDTLGFLVVDRKK